MKKNILVTGSHRSGSTWVGDTITSAKAVRLVGEPFNLKVGYDCPLTYWFEYIDSSTSARKQKKVKHYLNSYYEPFHISNLKKLFRFYAPDKRRSWLLDFKSRLHDRAIIKDPIALMSAEWLYQTFDWNMVILIRHPAAFVASLKVQDWKFPFHDLLHQTNLLNTHLRTYAADIQEYANAEKDIISQGILLWNIMHSVIYRYKEKYNSNWYFAKHEDLSLNPIGEFKKMFSYLQLPFDDKVQQHIIDSTKPKEESRLKRNAKENIKSWKNRLSLDEIDEIKKGTKDVWRHFYTEEDW